MNPAGKILIAEGDRNLRLLLEAALVRSGYGVTCVETGQEAVTRTIGELPDAVILDASLPSSTGAEAARSLRAFEATRHIPLLFLGGGAAALEKDPPAPSGRDRVLVKPFHLRELLDAISGILSGAPNHPRLPQ